MTKRIAVVLLSGGLDSSVLAYYWANRGCRILALSVDYAQRHGKKELAASWEIARLVGAEQHKVISLGPVAARLLDGSALTSPNIAVPHGHYAAESMKQTVVPNRNALLLSLAFAWATSAGADIVSTAVHAGDHAIYPDCRPEFITAFDRMETLATEGYGHARLYAPFVEMTKAEIVTVGELLHVPFAATWSCYEGKDYHCGECGTCVERKEAFANAGVADPTRYEAAR